MIHPLRERMRRLLAHIEYSVVCLLALVGLVILGTIIGDLIGRLIARF